MNEPVLCYIDGNFAYFTTQDLKEQWGDDWDDAPYEHNAEIPYEPCWHNRPEVIADPTAMRGWRPGTKEPYAVGERCQCDTCKRDWNEDGTPKWEIIKVAFDGDFQQPCDNHLNSPYSVQTINAGAVAWLVSAPWSGSEDYVAIQAGTTLKEFCELVKVGGGNVYVRKEDEKWLK